MRRLLAALLALALLWLPALPASAPMPASPMVDTVVAMTDCAGHAAASADHHQAPAERPDRAHQACCILGQCPMLAALLPPQPRALPGAGLVLASEGTVGTNPAGVLRGPPLPPPRRQG